MSVGGHGPHGGVYTLAELAEVVRWARFHRRFACDHGVIADRMGPDDGNWLVGEAAESDGRDCAGWRGCASGKKLRAGAGCVRYNPYSRETG